MSQPSPPPLTVVTDASRRTFAPGSDVVIGRDLRADVRVVHPQVSRAHVMVRFDHGRWMAVDNNSLNGLFVDNRRVTSVEIHDGLRIFLGEPHEGCTLTFEVGRQGSGPVSSLPQTTVRDIPLLQTIGQLGAAPAPPSHPSQPFPSPQSTPSQPFPAPQGTPSQPFRAHPSTPHVGPSAGIPSGAQPTVHRPVAGPPQSAPMPSAPPPVQVGPANVQASGGGAPRATVVSRLLRAANTPAPTGVVTIGRADENDILVADVLASRLHATLIPSPAGVEIQDERSSNGTFVNGVRITRAFLSEGDTVTIGNIDLVYEGGTLVRRAPSEAATLTGGLEVNGVTWTIEGNKTLLNNISLSARPGTLTAVIGPSGAGKSTLARLIAGTTHPTSGRVAFEGHDIHAEYASLRSRIGMVPQDDVVHGQLTVNQALMYAAELRLPPDTTKEARAQVVAEVVRELEMTERADTRVDKLSGGQRKRASVALELLTGPSLLILDEPTSGLDPALDRQVMTMLRSLADAGRVVLVVTHSLTYLDVCDQVLLLAPGGKTAFCGPPSEIASSLGTKNWADIFFTVAEDPDAAHRRFLEQNGPQQAPPAATPPKDFGSPTQTSLWGQFSTIARRQVRLIVSDRGYFIFLALLPFIMGVLSTTVPGTVGFGTPNPRGDAPNEPAMIMVLLNFGAIIMGTALTVRTIIGEKAILLREQAVGLSTTAYLLAKIFVFSAFAMIQASIVVAIAVIVKGGPTKGAVLLGSPVLELWFDIALTCVASAMVGLALSALVKSNEQIMPLLVVAVMSQLVFSGGAITITGRLGLDQISWITPARWGYAAAASTLDLRALLPTTAQDSHWSHTPSAWLFDIAMLLLVCVGYAAFVRWRIRLRSA